MSTLRFRFVFNQGKAASQQRVTSSAILGLVENVAFRYADRTYERIRSQIATRVHQDVMTEFSLMAGLFKRFVIGIGNGNTAPLGTLVPAHAWATVSRSAGMKNERAGQGITWNARGEKYMSWKQKHFHQSRWFLNHNTVLPSALGSAQSWVGYFGPIEVKVRPLPHGNSMTSLGQLTSRSPYTAGKYTRFKSAEDSTIRTGVANISVSALTHITPGMLPALASGNMGDYAADGRRSGLMAKLPRDAAVRLGGRGQYRPTIEPFLAFYLTRAVPNALFLRIEQGLHTQLDILNRRSR